ncbi:hypothetical protein HZ996_04885 [Cryomorphaceae bacterium]|nr:hypothetical protein HZ996_04885 [Cryomorphaceae bacterium]
MKNFSGAYKSCIVHEVTPSNIGRYVLPLLKKLKSRLSDLECYVQIEPFVNEEEVISICSNENVKVLRSNEVHGFISNQNVQEVLFLTYSYRIPDLYWTSIYRLHGVMTAQIQHGMYMKYLSRDVAGFTSNLERKLVYLKRFVQLILANSNRLRLMGFLLNKDFLNSENIRKWLLKGDLSNIQSDHLFVWGEYWADWFTMYHYYPENREFSVIGNPDYFSHRNLLQEDPEDAITYICQTLVEDGRMTKKEHDSLMGRVSSFLPDSRKVYFKLHPRSDRSLYDGVLKNSNVTLRTDFPYTSHYLGHYSSMLILGVSEKSGLGLIEIDQHEVPEFFEQLAEANSGDPEKLKVFLKEPYKGTKKPRKIDYFFLRGTKDPDFVIVDKIMKK